MTTGPGVVNRTAMQALAASWRLRSRRMDGETGEAGDLVLGDAEKLAHAHVFVQLRPVECRPELDDLDGASSRGRSRREPGGGQRPARE